MNDLLFVSSSSSGRCCCCWHWGPMRTVDYRPHQHATTKQRRQKHATGRRMTGTDKRWLRDGVPVPRGVTTRPGPSPTTPSPVTVIYHIVSPAGRHGHCLLAAISLHENLLIWSLVSLILPHPVHRLLTSHRQTKTDYIQLSKTQYDSNCAVT